MLDITVSLTRKVIEKLAAECSADPAAGRAAARLRGLTATACFAPLSAPDGATCADGGGEGPVRWTDDLADFILRRSCACVPPVHADYFRGCSVRLLSSPTRFSCLLGGHTYSSIFETCVCLPDVEVDVYPGRLSFCVMNERVTVLNERAANRADKKGRGAHLLSAFARRRLLLE